MVGKINRLAAETQNALQLMAYLGNTAAAETPSIVLEISQQQVHAALWPAVGQEAVARSESAHPCAHDRIQEASYSLIPEQIRSGRQLGIGRPLATHTRPEERDQVIFDIVNQLNRGSALMTSGEEREEHAKLNLTAGRVIAKVAQTRQRDSLSCSLVLASDPR